MMKQNIISDMIIEECFGKYNISCRVGNFYVFDLNQASNELHTHDCYEIVIITANSGILFYEGKEYQVSKGDVIVTDPQISHEFRINKKTEFECIYFFVQIQSNSISKPITHEDHIVHAFVKNHQLIEKSQDQLMAYLNFIDQYNLIKKERGYTVYQSVKNLIIECLECLSKSNEHLTTSIPMYSTILDSALDYIDCNLHKKITVTEIATHVRTSKRNLQYLFMKHLKKTMIDYINQKKISLAAHYLTMQFSVQDTAMRIGINNTSQFTRLFKKYQIITPKRYQQLNAPNEISFGRRL